MELDCAAYVPAICLRFKPNREDASFHFQRGRNVGTAPASGIESRNCRTSIRIKTIYGNLWFGVLLKARRLCLGDGYPSPPGQQNANNEAKNNSDHQTADTCSPEDSSGHHGEDGVIERVNGRMEATDHPSIGVARSIGGFENRDGKAAVQGELPAVI